MKIAMRRESVLLGAMPTECFASKAAWDAWSAERAGLYENRMAIEAGLIAMGDADVCCGWCVLCERETLFRLPSIEAGIATNLREELVCSGCGTNARVRADLQLLKANRDFAKIELYITEQASPTYVWLQKHLRRTIGSEYVHDPEVRQRMQQYLVDLGGHGNIRFEDVTRLTLADASIDAIASFDVLEHVPDYRAALCEFARVLKTDGMLALTAPFVAQYAETLVRAKISGSGEIEHLQPPEYHGDPADSGGILCFYHFGWDLLSCAREAGFSQAFMVDPWSPGMGLMDRLWTLVAIR